MESVVTQVWSLRQFYFVAFLLSRFIIKKQAEWIWSDHTCSDTREIETTFCVHDQSITLSLLFKCSVFGRIHQNFDSGIFDTLFQIFHIDIEEIEWGQRTEDDILWAVSKFWSQGYPIDMRIFEIANITVANAPIQTFIVVVVEDKPWALKWSLKYKSFIVRSNLFWLTLKHDQTGKFLFV